MTQQNILALAKQGNSQAITSLIARPLQAKGIIPKASLKGQCLRVMLESMQVPDQQAMVQFIHHGMIKLRIESIKTVKIYARKTGQEFPAWSQELKLEYLPENSHEVKLLPTKDCKLEDKEKLSHNGCANSKYSSLKQKPVYADLSNSVLVAFSADKNNKKFVNQPKTKQKILGISVIGKILVISLLLQICCYILFVIYDLVWAASSYAYWLLDLGDATGIMAYLLKLLVIGIEGMIKPLEWITSWIHYLLILVMLIWLYRLHASLRNTDRNYPISPWGAIARFIIPFYSFWGIWNIFATLAQRLKLHGGQQLRQGSSLKWWLPWLYFAWITTSVLYQIYRFQVRGDYDKSYYLWFITIRDGFSLFLSIVWIKIVCIINHAIADKAITNLAKSDYSRSHIS